MKSYVINEVFYSLQGEGVRAGTANIFVRFSGCNLACNGKEVEPGVFQPVCDTEFVSGRKVNAAMLLDWVEREGKDCKNIIFTGGEPTLQLDDDLAEVFRQKGYYLAIETNGTKPVSDLVNWVTCSPKTAEHTLILERASEIKYVRGYGMGIPKPKIDAEHQLISPHVESDGTIRPDVMKWCVQLVKENPKWRLSCQQHKQWLVR